MDTQNIKLIQSKIIEIKAERNPDFSGKLKLTTQLKIRSIKQLDNHKDILKIHYALIIDYADLGKILISGIVLIKSNETNIKNILQEYENKNNDKLIDVINVILQKTSIKALQIEEELGLPPHMQLPNLSTNTTNK
jgi:hypothetical protein